MWNKIIKYILPQRKKDEKQQKKRRNTKKNGWRKPNTYTTIKNGTESKCLYNMRCKNERKNRWKRKEQKKTEIYATCCL